MEEKIKKFIINEYYKVFGQEPNSEILNALVEEFKRVKEEFIKQAFTEEEAETLAKAVIKNGIQLGKFKLETGGF